MQTRRPAMRSLCCATGTALAAALCAAAAVLAAGDPPHPDVGARLDAVRTYQYGESRVPLVAVEERVNASAAHPEMRARLAARLAAMLSEGITPDAGKFVLSQLSLIGGDKEVPSVARWLSDAQLHHAARSALARIPGEASRAALRGALNDAQDTALIGIMNTLGELGDARSVAVIAPHLKSADMETAAAAADALGKIGGAEAVKALRAAGAFLRGRNMPVRAEALMKCAHKLRGDGDSEAAAAIFAELLADCKASHLRAAAFLGLMSCRGAAAAESFASALNGEDVRMHRAALAWVRAADAGALAACAAALGGKGAAAAPLELAAAIMDREGWEADAPLAGAVQALLDAAAASGRPMSPRAAALLVAARSLPNLAAGGRAESPDGLEGDGASSGDAAAIDGDPGTYWDEVDGHDLYRLVVHLREASTVSAALITGYQHHSFAPKDLDVICDGVTVAEIRGAVYEDNRLLVTFTPVRCAVFELRITGYYGGSPAIRELELYDLTAGLSKE